MRDWKYPQGGVRRQALTLFGMVSGRRILARLDELNRSQWLSGPELLALQQDKLWHLLVYAYRRVPYYRRVFDQTGFQPDDILADISSLRRLPLLTKAIIRDNFDNLLTTDPKRRATLQPVSTSGSTGHPLHFMQDLNFRDYFTADVHRHLGWSGWQFGQPHAYLGGASFAASPSLRARLMDWTFNRFTANAYVLSPALLDDFVSRIRQHHPYLLYGYASSLYQLAQFVQQNNWNDIKFKAVNSSAEVLYAHQRRFIEVTFNCKVFDRYATREVGEIGCQCEFQTGLHVSVENVYVEVLNDQGDPTGKGEPGYIVVTNLNNYGMPFIRYRLADMVSWYPAHSCACGRAQPMLSVVEGRHNDMFKTRDGRIVWGGLANSLWQIEGIEQFQLIQKTYDLVIVRLVTHRTLPNPELTGVEKAIQTVLGDNVAVKFEFPEAIPLEKSGKYRYQICEID